MPRMRADFSGMLFIQGGLKIMVVPSTMYSTTIIIPKTLET